MIHDPEDTDFSNEPPHVINLIFDGDEDLTIRQEIPEPETLPVPEGNGELEQQVTVWFEGGEDIALWPVPLPEPTKNAQ